MKPRTLFLVFVGVMIAVVIINYLLTREETKVPLRPEITPQQEMAQQEEGPARDYSYLLPPPSIDIPGITVIKKTAPPKSKAATMEAQAKTEKNAATTILPTETTAASVSGVKNNEYLTEDQKKDLRARNIVLF